MTAAPRPSGDGAGGMTTDEYAEIHRIYTGGWRCGFLWGLIGGSAGAVIGGVGAVAGLWWAGLL